MKQGRTYKEKMNGWMDGRMGLQGLMDGNALPRNTALISNN